MDEQLIDSLIKIVTEDSGKTNVYNHLEDLILMLNEEELDYFLEQCNENLFQNYNLSLVLATTIPHKMKEYAKEFVENKLNIIDLMEESLKKEYSKGRIDQKLYDETIKEYTDVRKKADNFLTLYMIEIDKKLSNKT